MAELRATEMVAPNMHLLTVYAPQVARGMRPGQFVIVRAEEEGERIPLSVSDWDAAQGTLSIVFMNVGATTNALASLPAGSRLPTVVGPLGKPTEIDKFGTVLCVGGCYGIGSIYPIARALHEVGNRVVVVLEARSSFLLFWEDRLRAVADQLYVITRDGSKGLRGHVGRLAEIIVGNQPVHRIVANGCTFLLKRVCDVSRPFAVKTIVSLNPIMIDGTGMCGVCRVSVGGGTQFACVDGPDFDGHQVDWTELLQRRKQYLREETLAYRSSGAEELVTCHGHVHG
jgi:ferredoxin--NADP+ reductase